VRGGTPSAVIDVIEFSDKLLHVRASGQYCLGADYDKNRQCRNPQDFEAEIVKPFGWTYDSAQAFASVDTPGMEIYRRHFYEAIRAIPGLTLPAMPDPDQPPEDPTDTSPTAPTASSVACDCSCTSFIRTRQLMKEKKKTNATGQMDPEVLSIMSCSLQCMGEWSQCKRKKN
jgi:hypothetical protein